MFKNKKKKNDKCFLKGKSKIKKSYEKEQMFD